MGVDITNTTAIHQKSSMDEKSKLKLQRALQDFESVFVGYLLKSMRAGIPKNDSEGDAFGSDLMQGMFDMELAKHISHNSSFGLGNLLYQQMTGEAMPRNSKGIQSPATLEKLQPVSAFPVPSAAPQPKASPGEASTEMRKVDPPGVSFASAPAVSTATKPVGTVRPAATLSARLDQLQDIIHQAAQEHGLSSSLLKAVIATESGANVRAQSAKDAKGLMQLIDSTAAEMGVRNVWDPRENVQGGARYLKGMLERHEGDLTLALASYNAGPGAVAKHGGIPPFKETKQYVQRVLNFLQYFENRELNSNDVD